MSFEHIDDESLLIVPASSLDPIEPPDVVVAVVAALDEPSISVVALSLSLLCVDPDADPDPDADADIDPDVVAALVIPIESVPPPLSVPPSSPPQPETTKQIANCAFMPGS